MSIHNRSSSKLSSGRAENKIRLCYNKEIVEIESELTLIQIMIATLNN